MSNVKREWAIPAEELVITEKTLRAIGAREPITDTHNPIWSRLADLVEAELSIARRFERGENLVGPVMGPAGMSDERVLREMAQRIVDDERADPGSTSYIFRDWEDTPRLRAFVAALRAQAPEKETGA